MEEKEAITREVVEDKIWQQLNGAETHTKLFLKLSKSYKDEAPEDMVDRLRYRSLPTVNFFTLTMNNFFGMAVLKMYSLLFGREEEISFKKWGKYNSKNVQFLNDLKEEHEFENFKLWRHNIFAHQNFKIVGDPEFHMVVPVDSRWGEKLLEIIEKIKKEIWEKDLFKDPISNNYVGEKADEGLDQILKLIDKKNKLIKKGE